MIKPNRGTRSIGLAKKGFLLLVGLLVSAALANAQQSPITAGEPVTPTISQPASEAPEVRADEGPVRDVNPRLTHDDDERRRKAKEKTFGPEQITDFDPLALLQFSTRLAAPSAFSTPILSFNGQGFTGSNPPDTVGDVGPNHYVQSVNGGGRAVVRIYNKATGATIGAQFAMESLGTAQSADGAGDPIVLYDQAADRWLLSEFSGGGTNRLCVYISTTPNPAGTYFAYNFTAPGFPDYPKYGVWPNAYYVSTNESSPAVYALNRPNMILGLAATFVRSTAPPLSGFGFQALTPADVDGAAGPLATAPGIFMRQVDDEIHSPPGTPGSDALQIWSFSPNFVTPLSSTFTLQTTIRGTESFRVDRRPDVAGRNQPAPESLLAPDLVTEFNSTLCGQVSFSCMGMPGVAQAATASLDPLREVIMNRLVYRNFGTHETLLGNFVTDIGSDIGGVRWFELRRVGGGDWTLHQEGTYAQTLNDNRWMGGIAMDGSGNIALAYNVSSQTIFPSIRYTGRLAADPLGTMSQPEAVLGAGSANNASNRYGDYAAMSVDPSDDCTFWFTGQFNTASTWSTRISSFKFDQCVAVVPTPTPTPSPTPIPTPTPTPTPPGVAVTRNYTGPAVAIPDNLAAGINVILPVSGVAGTIVDLDVRFDGTAPSADPLATTVGVNHSWIGDLVFKITSPSGTTVTIVNRPGGPNCAGNNLFNLTLDDDGVLPSIGSQCPGGTNAGPLTGTFSPSNTLSVFEGQSANGNWTLNVSDNVGQDVGSVRAFSLIFAVTAPVIVGSVSGTVTYGTTAAGQPAKLVQGVGLAAAGLVPLNATSDIAGAYLLTGFGAGAYSVTPAKSGAVNGISALDASRVAQHAAGLSVLTPNQILAGDATNNGTLSALDASRIAQFAAGIVNPGIAGQWKFMPVSKTYPSVAGPVSNENYDAILVGDVTGNWTPPAARPVGDREPISWHMVDPLWNRLFQTRSGKPDVVDIQLPGNVASAIGTPVTLPITIGDTTAKGVVAYEFTLDFDPSVLSPTLAPISTAGTLSEGWSVTVNSEIPGQITVIAFSTEELAGLGTLLNLNFRVVRASSSSPRFKWTRFQVNEGEISSRLFAVQG